MQRHAIANKQDARARKLVCFVEHSQLIKQQWIAPYSVQSSPGSPRAFQRWQTSQVDRVPPAYFVIFIVVIVTTENNTYFASFVSLSSNAVRTPNSNTKLLA